MNMVGCDSEAFDIEIPWFMDMSWFTDVLKAIGQPNGMGSVNIINLFV